MNGILSVAKNLLTMEQSKKWAWLPGSMYRMLRDVRGDLRNTFNNIVLRKRYGSRASQIKKIKSLAKGRRVYVLATGPSIREIDLRALDGEFVILVNAAISLLDSFDPGFAVHAMVDSNRIREIGGIRHPKVNLYVRSLTTPSSIAVINALWGHVLEAQDVYIKPIIKWQKGRRLPVLDRDDRLGAISEDLEHGFYDTGNTVVFLAIQLGLYMGACEVVLCGVDMNFSNHSESNYGVYIKGMHVAATDSFQHKLVYMFNSYRAYMDELKGRDVVLSNASSQSKLTFLPRCKMP